MPPLPPFNFSWGSSSGVNGDTSSGPAADYFFSSPFAVGSGASATSDQAGGAKLPTWLLIVGGVVAVVLFVVTLGRRS